MDGATQRLAAPIAEPTLERRRVGVRRPEWFDVVIVAALAVAYAVVLPATTTLERNDIMSSSRDRYVRAMHQAIAPVGQARNRRVAVMILAALPETGGNILP